MPHLHSVSFSTEGWTPAEEAEAMHAWENQAGDMLSLHYFKKVPDLAGSLSEIGKIRNGYRAMIVQAGGALVEIVILCPGPSNRNGRRA